VLFAQPVEIATNYRRHLAILLAIRLGTTVVTRCRCYFGIHLSVLCKTRRSGTADFLDFNVLEFLGFEQPGLPHVLITAHAESACHRGCANELDTDPAVGKLLLQRNGVSLQLSAGSNVNYPVEN